MWAFGHLGIGATLAKPMGKKLPYSALLLGCVIPDVIDKPLYYGMDFFTHHHARETLISCTRTFGHMGLWVLAVSVLALFRKNRFLAGLSLGLATHIFLDGLTDLYFMKTGTQAEESSALLAALFPFYKTYFGQMPFHSVKAHLHAFFEPFIFYSEIIGFFLLYRETKRRRIPLLIRLQNRYFSSKKAEL